MSFFGYTSSQDHAKHEVKFRILLKAGQASVFKEDAEGRGEILPDAKVAVTVENRAIVRSPPTAAGHRSGRATAGNCSTRVLTTGSWSRPTPRKADAFALDNPRLWSNTQIFEPAAGSAWNLALAPDGKRFAVFPRAGAAGEQKGSVHVTVVLNFFDELRRRVPAGK